MRVSHEAYTVTINVACRECMYERLKELARDKGKDHVLVKKDGEVIEEIARYQTKKAFKSDRVGPLVAKSDTIKISPDARITDDAVILEHVTVEAGSEITHPGIYEGTAEKRLVIDNHSRFNGESYWLPQ